MSTGLAQVIEGMRAGQVAAGVNMQTLQYYERRGLLDPPDRTLGWASAVFG